MSTKPTFFAKPTEFRAWLQKHHRSAAELLVGFYKTGSGKPSMTWPEAVDEALCFGWIDGVGKSIDAVSYRTRFTPRKARSIWSTRNVTRARELIRAGRMRPAGRMAYDERVQAKSGTYSHEQKGGVQLDPADERRLRANKKAWAFFQAKAPSYRKAAVWWVISAKKEETRRKRLAALIDDSAHGRTIPPLTRRPTAT